MPADALMQGFPPETFARRRERVIAVLDDGALVLPAAPIRHRSGDSEYRYRPDSELFWLTGWTEPGAVAVLRPFADEERFVLFVRERDDEAERWTGPRLGPGRAQEEYAADAAHPLDEMEERLPELLAGARLVHCRLGAEPRTEALVRRALATARTKGRRMGTGPRGVIDPGELLDPLRMRKDEEELARIRRACRLTAEGVRRGMAEAAPGRGEWEVESAVEAAFRRGGASGPAFVTIVASGANACVLHYTDNRHVLGPDDLVLLDAGAEVDLYAGDATRTFPASGSFTPEQRVLYEVVLEARRAALERIVPGAAVSESHDASVRALTTGLVELAVLEGEVDALVEEEAYKPFFPHQTSHWLGLDVHDAGDYARRGEPLALEPGMVLTVEPGLYFPEEGGDGGRFAGTGIRVEDDVLVTADGPEVLTGDLPVDPEGVEALVGAAGGGRVR